MAPRELDPKHKRELKNLIRKTRSFFNKKRFHARSQVLLDNVVLAHISKSLSVADAVMCLIEANLSEEAFGLSRTLVEIALNLRFITNRYSERRAKRFVHYFARWKMELIRRTLKHYGTKYTKAQLRTLMRDYQRSAKLARKYPKGTSWTKTRNRKSKEGVWMMANEPDKHESVDGVPFKWEFDYDWIYFWTSQYVHATVVSLDSHAASPLEPFLMSSAPEAGRHTAGLAAFNAAVYLHKILVMAFRAIGHPFDENISTPLEKLLKDMARDRSSPPLSDDPSIIS